MSFCFGPKLWFWTWTKLNNCVHPVNRSTRIDFDSFNFLIMHAPIWQGTFIHLWNILTYTLWHLIFDSLYFLYLCNLIKIKMNDKRRWNFTLAFPSKSENIIKSSGWKIFRNFTAIFSLHMNAFKTLL